MSGATTAAWVGAAVAAVGTAVSAMQQEDARKSQEKAAREQLEAQKKQTALNEEAQNKANAKKANIEGLLESGNDDVGSTSLTGSTGVTIDKSMLGKGATLGGV